MPKGALSKRHVEGIGEGSLLGTLSALLQLTSEVVLIFDGAGRVLLANEEAMRLFGFENPGAMMGVDVRLLFPMLDGEGPDTGSGSFADAVATPMSFSPTDLPFECDGSTVLATCRTAAGLQEVLRVRCERVQAPGDTYLLVGRAAGTINAAGREYDRAFEELKRANKRLSGAFNIVLDTLDAEDMGELFGRVLDEITETMEADGTLAYLAETDGFRLRGASQGLDISRTPRFMPFGRTVETAATRSGRTVRLRVQAPTADELRGGKLTSRNVVNEETREILKVRAALLPPFTSFHVVPVWFGGHVIAIIEVGWEKVHPLFKEDAGLLNSVGRYLSVQLVGAFATMRSQKAARLDTLQNDLREELLSVADGSAKEGASSALERLDEILTEVAHELEAGLVRLRAGADGEMSAELPLTGAHAFEGGIDGLVAGHVTDGAAVVDLRPATPLSQELHGLGEPCYGALVDLGVIAGERHAYLMLRPDGSEPLDEVEHAFLVRFAADVRDIAQGEEARAQDKRISQALQLGMKNVLQDVDGITAQGIYSSATATAFVGGDFYDLIRLPGRRACVIMGDVSGKGVEAASVSAAVKTALGAYSWEGLNPARMVRSLNDFLLGFSRVETFATLFVGIVDLAARTITYCSAGHPPALLVHDREEISILDVQSGVVGAFADIAYQDGQVGFEPGDLLLLYTDGTTEARDPSGAFFGEQGLRDMVMREWGQGQPFEGLLDRFLATLDAFTGQRLDDDVAMVCLRFDEEK